MNKTKVTIYSELMGQGKSSKAIERINDSDKEQRFIVVVPFLAETHRYAGTICDPESGEKQTPLKDECGKVLYNGTGCNKTGRRFQHPTSGYKTKVEHIADLVFKGKDIVTTHAALKLFTTDTIKDVKDAGYTLVIDESLECVRPHPVKTHRRKMLLDSGAVYEDESSLLRWNEDFLVEESKSEDSTGFSWDMQIKRLCDTGSLILVGSDNDKRDLFMWEYPVNFIKAFDNIEVLTYLFDGSVFHKYLQYYNIDFKVEYGVQLPDNVFDLINVVSSEKMNRIGDRESSFSVTDQRRLTKDSATAVTVRSNLNNFFRNGTYGKSKTHERLWTCLGESTSIFKGAGYTKRHIAHNTKATNDYIDTHQVAYIFNAHLNPEVYKFLSGKGSEFAPCLDTYALSELLQFIFRSRVRVGLPINLYIPNSRMRGLLLNWMEGKVVSN